MKRILVTVVVGAWAFAGCTGLDALLAECDAGLGVCARDAGGGLGGGTGGGVGGGTGGAVEGGPDGGPDAGAADAGSDAGEADAGSDAGVDAGEADAGVSPPGACPGFTVQGSCWVNPAPTGEDLVGLYEEPSGEVWAGGTAGVVMRGSRAGDGGWRWEDFTLPNALRQDAWSASVDWFVPTDGGLLAFGMNLAPRVWTAAGWGPWRDGSWSNGDWFDAWSVTSDGRGGFMAVGEGDSVTPVAVWGDGAGDFRRETWTKYLSGRFTAVMARPNTGYWKAFTNSTSPNDGVHSLVRHDGGEDSTLLTVAASPDNQKHVRALWPGPNGVPLYAGADCVVGRASAAEPPWAWSWVHPCSAAQGTSWLNRGAYSAALNRHVVTGGEGAILEFGPSGLPATQSLSTVAEWSYAYRRPELQGLLLWPDGGGLVVGTGGTLLARTMPLSPRPWRQVDAALRTDLFTAVALDGGWLVAGGAAGQVVVASVDGGAPVLPADAVATLSATSTDELWSAAEVGGAAYLVTARGGVYSYVPGRPLKKEVDSSLSSDTPLHAIAGSSAQDVTAVGQAGTVLRWGAPTWSVSTLRLPDGGTPDLVGVAQRSGKTWIVSRDAVSDAQLFLVGAWDAGAQVEPVRTPGRVYGLAVSPSGALWMTQEGPQLVRRDTDGGQTVVDVNSACATGCRYSQLGKPLVLADDDIYFAGSHGLLLHWDGTALRYVETGTRINLESLAVTTDGAGRRTLWMVGAYGAILRRPL